LSHYNPDLPGLSFIAATASTHPAFNALDKSRDFPGTLNAVAIQEEC
jgi:hypothetical protein